MKIWDRTRFSFNVDRNTSWKMTGSPKLRAAGFLSDDEEEEPVPYPDKVDLKRG